MLYDDDDDDDDPHRRASRLKSDGDIRPKKNVPLLIDVVVGVLLLLLLLSVLGVGSHRQGNNNETVRLNRSNYEKISNA